MNLARMMTDKVFFEDRHGSRSGPYKTKFGADRITVFQDELHVAEGDRVIQPLPDGSEHVYIAGPVTRTEARRNIPAHFSIALAGEAATVSAAPREDEAHVAAALQRLADGIEHSRLPGEQKDEARRILRMLAEHPVIAALAGTDKGS
ncbi:hypothetical protein [Noviherbaspirillum sp. ST9]|uniref:hypothetical protein n=1 Tax=Noviherbaspirillum sp. ST9 TaxID=3401606 RepID=UPI003B586B51